MKFELMISLCAAAVTAGAAEIAPIEENLAPAEGVSVVGLSVIPSAYFEYPGSEFDVKGLRFNLLAGHHREVCGLDIGSIANWTDGDLNGVSVAGVGNCCAGATFGIHLSSVINYAESGVNGLQLALVNSAWGVGGLQLGFVNATSEGRGVQIGAWNMAECFRGMQVGLVNVAMHCTGIQLGFGNIIADSPLTACVFVNACF